jgi:hypothetical protein
MQPERKFIENRSLLGQGTSSSILNLDDPRERPLFQSDVALVTVLARVEDSTGRYLADLQRDEFHLFEYRVEKRSFILNRWRLHLRLFF